MTKLRRVAHWALILCAVAICIFAVVVLARDIQALTLDRISDALARISSQAILASLALTAVSFFVLGAYDVLATHIATPGRVMAFLAWFAGAAGNAVSNTLGFHAVTGTVVRYRLYRTAGLDLSDTVRVTSLSWATVALGFVTVSALTLLFQSSAALTERIAGAGLLAALGILLYWRKHGAKQISFAGISLPLPSARIAATQMALGAVEMASAIGALYVLMPFDNMTSFLGFSAAYIGAVLLGIVSHAPGGIGVFEAAMLSFAGGQDRAGVLAALLFYRLVYNLVPFVVAVLALAGFGLLNRRRLSLTAGNAG